MQNTSGPARRVERSFQRRIAVALAVCAAVASAVPHPAGAQERGWFGRDTPRTISPRPGSPFDDRDPAQVYADARADIEHGNIAFGQRRLEWLIARYPNSPLAEVARRDLQGLYELTNRPPARERVEATDPRRPFMDARPASQPGYEPAETMRRPRETAVPDAMAGLIKSLAEELRLEAGDRVFFADGSADIGTRARSAIEAQAEWLKRRPQVRVTIEGHADDSGQRVQMQALSLQRAEAVKARLIEFGVPAERIQTIGIGRDNPVAACAEALCTSQNRRAVTVLTAVSGSGVR
jgi:peptidoglycan-associated lipoprotein